jgi:hypothetical protein
MTKKKRLQKPPKDLIKYTSGLVAGRQLIDLALHYVLMLRQGVRVRWELKLKFYYDPTFSDKPNVAVRMLGGSFSSRPEEDEEPKSEVKEPTDDSGGEEGPEEHEEEYP